MSKMWSNNLKDLLSKLFLKSAEERIKFIPLLKEHPWFNGLDWQKML